MKWSKKLKKVCVMALTLAMIGNSVDLSALYAEAEEGQNTVSSSEAAESLNTVSDSNVISDGDGEAVVYSYEEIVELPATETSAMPVGFFSLTEKQVSITGTAAEKWIDRLDLSKDTDSVVTTFYNNLVEWTDNDGTDDYLITGEKEYYVVGSKSGTISPASDSEADVDSAMSELAGELFANYDSYLRAAYDAFDRDHPEVFWLSGETQIGYSVQTEGNNCTVTLMLILNRGGFDMRAAGYQSQDSIETAISARDAAANELITAAAEKSVAEKIEYFNEQLAMTNEYNTSSDLNSIGHDCRECVSALTGSTGVNGPVCEGYARAFKVLCDAAGIPCVLVDGQAFNSADDETGEAHMWNYVQVDGSWYAVDVTWNDPVVTDGNVSAPVSGSESEDWLLVGSDTEIDGMKFSASHIMQNTVSSGGVSFINGPELSADAYKEPDEYYLFGTINGSSYGEDDNLGTYKLVDGKLTVIFEKESQIAVKNQYNEKWYAKQNGPTENGKYTLYKFGSAELGQYYFPVKIPSDAEFTFTLDVNADGTLGFNYDITGEQISTVYCDIGNEWNGAIVNAYVFADKGVYNNWPGAAMTWVEGTIYSFEVPQDMEYIIFNNGSSQTADLAIPTNGKNLYTLSSGSWSSYTPPHQHTWDYINPEKDGTVQKNVISAVCTESHSECDNTDGGSITLTAPETLIYDGTQKTASVTGELTTGAAVSGIVYQKQNEDAWENMTEAPIGIGTYKAIVTVTDGSEQAGAAEIEFTIEAADMTNSIKVTAYNGTYDPFGNNDTDMVNVTIYNSGIDATITYSTDDGNTWSEIEPVITNVGNLSVMVKVTAPNYKDYLTTVTATKAPYDISNCRITAEQSEFYYNGLEIQPQISGLTNDIGTFELTVQDCDISYDNNINVGTGAKISVTGKGNYTGTVNDTFTIKYYDGEVTPLYNGINAIAQWYNSDVAISAVGYTVSETLDGTFKGSVSIGGEGLDVSRTLYFKQNGTGYITDGKLVTVNIDKTAPSFDAEDDGITIDSNRWNTLLNNLTFGIFFKDTKTVTIHATDTAMDSAVPSGVARYYYYMDTTGSEMVLTSEELQEKTFTEDTDGNFNIADDNKYVIYAYVVDTAGNRSGYICSDGAVLDMTAPGELKCKVSEITSNSAVLTVSAADTGSGVKKYGLIDLASLSDVQESVITDKGNGVFEITNLKPNTAYGFGFWAEDYAGNRVKNSEDYTSLAAGFTTAKLNISAAVITVNDTCIYDGDEQKPSITVKYGTDTLTAGNDYVVSYSDNVNAGIATVTVTAAGNSDYTGEASLTFSIARADLKTGNVPEFTVDYGYKGADASTEEDAALSTQTDEAVSGTWTLKDTESHVVQDGAAGAVFVPNDTNNYNTLQIDNAIVTVIRVTPVVELSVDKSEQVAGKSVRFTVSMKHPKYGDFTEGLSTAYTVNALTQEASGWQAIDGLTYIIAEDMAVGATIQFRLNVEAAGKYTAAQSEVLIVTVIDKENVDELLSLHIPDITYGSKPEPQPAFNGTGDGEYSWSYLYKKASEADTEYRPLSQLVNGSSVLDVGAYNVKASYTDASQQGEVTAAFAVNKRTLIPIFDVSGITKVYDGTTEVNGIPVFDGFAGDSVYGNEAIAIDMDSITYSYDDVNAGTEKNITIQGIRLTGAGSSNYTIDSEVAVSGAEIMPKKVTVTAEVPDKTYDGTQEIAGDITLTLNGVITGDALRATIKEAYFNGARAGEDKIVRIYLELSSSNYTAYQDPDIGVYYVEGFATIHPKELTVNVTVADKQYDGLNTAKITKAELAGIIGDDEVILTNGTATFESVNVAEDIKILFTDFSISGDYAECYDLQQPSGITASIVNDWNPVLDIDYIVNGRGWMNENFEVYAKIGCQLSMTNIAEGVWSETLIGSAEGADSQITFYVKDTQTGAISEAATVKYKLDKTPATGTVSVGENSWNTFLNNITFGLLFNETQTLKVVAEDTLSGVAKVEYYESVSAVSLANIQVLADAEWTELTGGSVDVTAVDAKKFVYYIRITDVAGNVTYLSTNGAEFDTTAPVIAGVTDGGTYYATQSVTIEDKYLESVTLKTVTAAGVTSENAAATFKLIGDTEAEYTITAVDEAGNSTVVTVTMKAMEELTEGIENLTVGNVTSENKAALEAAKEAAESEDLSNATEEEAEILKDVAEKSAALLAQLEAAEVAAATDNIKVAENVTEDTVKVTDIEKLEAAETDLKNALKDYGSNYTDQEKGKLQDGLSRIQAALKIAKAAESAADAIAALPEADGFDAGDEAVETAYKAAKEAYDALTDKEKAAVGAAYKAKLDAVGKALMDYRIVEGVGGSWTQGADTGLRFKANGTFSKFTGIKVDAKDVSVNHYTAESGSTIIVLKQAYLDTLAAGKHSLTVCYTDGKAVCEFTIQEKTTGDQSGDGGSGSSSSGNSSADSSPAGNETTGNGGTAGAAGNAASSAVNAAPAATGDNTPLWQLLLALVVCMGGYGVLMGYRRKIKA